MSEYRIYIIAVMMMMPCLVKSQETYIDVEMDGLQGSIAGALGILLHYRAFDLTNQYRELRREEREFMRDKLRVAPEPEVALLEGFLQLEINEVRNMITNAQTRIGVIRAIPPFVWPGLDRLETDLTRETAYFDEVANDPFLETGSPRTTGGAEYTLRYRYSRLLRLKKIRSNVRRIRYEIDNLNIFSGLN